MENPLRVLVQVDTRNSAASIEVRGALTGRSCGTLLNILRHTATLGANISVNLTRAVRIEAAALEVLRGAAGDVERSAPAGPPLRVRIDLPPEAGTKPDPGGAGSLAALGNDAALEMILHRDARVLAGPQSTDAPQTALPRESAPRWRVLPGRRS